MFSVGHDEYWSWEMRDVLENRIEKGLNVAWFTGNSVYWQTRHENDNTTMVCYKVPNNKDPIENDPEKKHLLTTIWSDPRLDRSENSLLGLSFNHGGYVRIGGATPLSAGGYQVYRPEHWVFENTGLRWVDQLGNEDFVVGYEVDGVSYTIDEEGYPVPTGKDGTPTSAIILGLAPASLWNKEETPQYILGKIPDSELVAMALTGDRKNWRQFTRGN
ncbi:N,N-dimethylformamidase beta subunit family domain-containing protein [Thiolapillus sp.]|uniref:N,N-dimethylformamidase beta subunit family domain-containing protein n=1 Tax=Thiolapillus sp. TaxID=2017437 RepID=UPI003AF5182E